MFQLIVAVISIALVAALALASIYYGGSAFNQGQLKAQVTTLINQAQQIVGANTLYKTDNGGSNAASVAALVPTYLAVAPSAPSKITSGAWAIDTTAKTVYVPLNETSDLNAAIVAAGVGTDDGTKYYFPL